MTNNNDLLPAQEGGAPSRFLVFGSPDIGHEEINEVIDSLKSGWIGTGPKTKRFEDIISEKIGVRHVIALNSCTAGLHLALLACGITRGDEVITTPLTFAATANVIEHVGATPIFVDVELNSMNIDPRLIESKITKRTKAIMPVHFAGRPCDMDKILSIAKKHNLFVIEDAAHAFGAEYKNKKVGTIGDITVFSFYVTKNITTGEGGAVTTNNQKISEFIRLYSLHGLSKDAWKRYSDEGFKHYYVEAPGYKYNMMDIQASIGIHQLAKFDTGQIIRESIWNEYNKAFCDLPLILPAEPERETVHARHLYTILVKSEDLKVSRETIQEALHAEGIGIGIHFISLHLHPYYKNKYNFKRGDFPNAEFVSDRTISLPLSSKLTNTDIKDVIKAVRKVLVYYSHNKSSRRRLHLPKSV